MPGIVLVSIWKKSVGDSFEFSGKRTFAVFGVTPGVVWSGFESFLRSLAREYNATHVQLHDETPSEQESSYLSIKSEVSLLEQADVLREFTFPPSGRLGLLILVVQPFS